jgi:L,D-transpeptidase YcbB
MLIFVLVVSRFPVILAFFSIFAYACHHKSEKKEEVKVVIQNEADIDALMLEDLNDIRTRTISDSVLVIEKDTLFTYSYFDSILKPNQLLFYSKGKLTPLGDSVWHCVANAREYGLYPNTYHYSLLQLFKTKSRDSVSKQYNITALTNNELLLLDAYLLFGAHLSKGRFLNDSTLALWRRTALDSNWLDTMRIGLKTHQLSKTFRSLEPKHTNYHFLKTALKNYIAINDSLQWDSIASDHIADTIAWRKSIAERLKVTGDYNDTLNINDSLKLAKAIKSFQKKYHLEPDGKLGKYTKQALRLNKENSIRQIEMALEHWRWEPNKFPERYAFINIPSADMKVWEYDKKEKKDTLVMESRVVVGKPETKTPLLKSRINFIQIYPYWSVPYSIAWKEILPMVQRDTSYLRRKNFEVVNSRGEVLDIKNINFKKYSKDYLPVKFRQRIGGDNSLGICKFNFPNMYGVYLHDTNSKRYFKTFYRYQSHGCIRLEKFKDLARFLIRDDTLKLPYDTLEAYFSRTEQRRVDLKKSLPIYVRYYTAQTDSLANLQLYLDIYSKDERMMGLIYR